MHPLGSGDHFASALQAAGIAVRPDAARGTWSVDAADPAAVVETFFTCARERAQDAPDEPLRLVAGDSDLLSYEAYWEDGELVVTLVRQFALQEEGEEEGYLDHLYLELRTRSAPADTPESRVVEGTGGSDATVDDWARRVRADPAFAATTTAPVGVVCFGQGPV